MDFLIVSASAALAAGLTLFSGFGLGTLLLPAFALFFPVEIAVAATAVVHLANNLFKLVLVGRFADRHAVLVFGVPAALAAFAGAWILGAVSELAPVASYRLGPIAAEVTWVKLAIGPLIVVFALFDLLPGLLALRVERRWLPLGGVLSGFFGGLSGHQGALRSTFLIKAGLDRDAFIGTGVAAAVLVDLARLSVYGLSFVGRNLGALAAHADPRLPALVGCATLAAFAGSFLGSRLLPRVTLGFVQRLVGAGIVVVGVALAAGWL